MPNRDVFALDRSGFNGFLFAPIGTEPDGSRLTVLSALARLELDPWATAASWARMPKAASGQALAATIAQMPVTPADQMAAADTAARLVLLLSPNAAPTPKHSGPSEPPAGRRLAVVLAVLAVLGILVGSAVLISRQGTQAVSLAGPVASTAP